MACITFYEIRPTSNKTMPTSGYISLEGKELDIYSDRIMFSSSCGQGIVKVKSQNYGTDKGTSKANNKSNRNNFASALLDQDLRHLTFNSHHVQSLLTIYVVENYLQFLNGLYQPTE